MELDLKTSAEIAQSYFRSNEPLVRLGWGISGFVYLSPDTRTAVKVHRNQQSFDRELYVYRKLAMLKMNRLHGLTIPKLRGEHSESELLCMDFVSAPYLLDFAGVGLSPPDFSPETMAHWHAGIAEMFGPNSRVPYAVYHSLGQHDLYYMDFRPSNIKLDGLPGLHPIERPTEDEFGPF